MRVYKLVGGLRHVVDSYGFAFICVNLFLIIGKEAEAKGADDLLRFPSCLLYTKLV